MTGLLERGADLWAGPFEDLSRGGLAIFRGMAAQDVTAVVAQDPAVQAGVLRAEIIPWRGRNPF